MELPSGLRWIEVDFPRVIALKEQELAREQPRCRLEQVKLDLADAAARRALIASLTARKLLVLTEGVTRTFRTNRSRSSQRTCGTRCASWVLASFAPGAMQMRERTGMTTHLRNALVRF